MFAKRLKESRQKLGLSQDELGIKINSSQNTISQWENEVREPESLDDYETLAKILNIDPAWLVGWDEVKEETKMRKTIIKLQPGDVVTVDKDKVIIESKENTTAENSDVKCFGTSDNPMTESEWDEYRRTVKAGPRPD